MQNCINIVIKTHARRTGFTLVELLLSTGIIALVATALVGLTLNSYSDFLLGSRRSELLQDGHGSLDRLIRILRQTRSISAVSDSTSTSASITFLDVNNVSRQFKRNSTTNELEYGSPGSLSALAGSLTSLALTCYDANATALSDPVDVSAIQSVLISANFTHATDASVTFSLSNRVFFPSLSGASTTVVIPNIAVSDKIEVKNAGQIVAISGTLTVSTNATGNDKIKVKDTGVINGNVLVGVGGDSETVVKVTGLGQITGTTDVLETAITIPTPTEPSLGASVGDVRYSSGTTTLSSDLHCNKLEIKSLAILEISGDITILAEGEVKIRDLGQLRILPDSTLTVYSKSTFKVEGGGRANVNTADVTKVTINHTGSGNVEIKGVGQLYARIIAPNAELKVKDVAHCYCTFRGKKVKVEGLGRLHAAQYD